MIKNSFMRAGAGAKRSAMAAVSGVVLAAVLLMIGGEANAQDVAPIRNCVISTPVDSVVQRVPGDCTLPGTQIDIVDLPPGAGDLFEDDPIGAPGLLFQQSASFSQAITGLTGGLAANLGMLAMDLGFADAKGAGLSGGGLVNAPLTAGTPGRELSMFAVSGVTKLKHDGYESRSSIAGGSGRTPDFEEVDAGLTLGMRWDASDYFGLAKGALTLGLIANYTHTEIDLGTNDVLAKYFDRTGSAEVDSWSVGTFGLVTNGRTYGLVSLTGSFGMPSTENAVLASTADFETTGFAASAMSGVLIPVGGSTLDLRGGFNYITASADDYTDSIGLRFRDAEMEEFSGTVSARLFHVVRLEQGSMRPFIQSGLTHRLSYKNEVSVEDVEFSFDDADTTVFARAGVDFEIDRSLQAYLAVRGDASETMEAIAAQVGFTFKLD